MLLDTLSGRMQLHRPVWSVLFLVVACWVNLSVIAFPQDAGDSDSSRSQVVDASELTDLANAAKQTQGSPAGESAAVTPGMDFFSLLLRGGAFMIPIALVSLLVVTMALERAFMLRRSKILPPGLVRGLGQLAREHETLEPRSAYKLCQQFPSAASNVIRTMLLKIGRPHSEVESAVKDSTQREADRLYSNVKWLNLSAGIAPLLGLLGTVWGLIQAFHDTTQLGVSQNRAEYLAKGIYEALVTTLAGLIVAIPAAMLSHYFEGKITNLFRQIDELMFNLMQQIERYEGKTRFEPAGKELVMKEPTASPVVSDSHEKLARALKSGASSGSSARSVGSPDR